MIFEFWKNLFLIYMIPVKGVSNRALMANLANAVRKYVSAKMVPHATL